MSVAARWAGWQRLRNIPGPLSGASLAGVPLKRLLSAWPSARLVVEAAFGADLTGSAAAWPWTDITTDVMFEGGPVSISPRGRSDETSKSQPAGCNFRLLNTSGDYGTGPAGKWYPYVRRNTPIRVRVTLDGSSWYTRFQGFANGFTPSWNTKGNVATVNVSASGALRRLDRRKTPLKSPLWRASEAAGPLAHWPMEEARGATQGESALSGGTPFVVHSGTATFAAHDDCPGAVQAPELIAGKLQATLPTTTGAGWAAHFAIKLTQTAPGVSVICPVTWTSPDGGWVFTVYIDNASVIGSTDTQPAGNDGILTSYATTSMFDGEWHSVLFMVTELNATTMQGDLWVDGVLTTSSDTPNTFPQIGGTVSFPDESIFTIINVESCSISHLAFFQTTTGPDELSEATQGYEGEAATDRLARLCEEESVTINVAGSSDTTMGVQSADTFANLLRECETADDGALYDGNGSGLDYTARATRYNASAALTADMAAEQVAPPFEPVDDDQRDTNVSVVSRKNGTTATFEQTTGPLGTDAIDTYDAGLTVNTDDDTGLRFRAAWEVHKGTAEGRLRYPNLSLDLCASPSVAPAWLETGVSSRIDVTNVSSKALQHPPGDVDLLLEGWTETISPTAWSVSANCSPFEPWRVTVIEGTGDTTWRIDSGSSTLAAGAAVGATSLSVASSSSVEPWSTAAGDYPRSVDVGGVEVTVTAVAGAASPQTFTVDALPYALQAGWQVKLWRPPTIAL